PDQTWAAVLSDPQATTLGIWEFPSGRKVREILLPGKPGPRKLAVTPDGKTLAVADCIPKAADGGKVGEVTLWEPGTGKFLRTLTLKEMPGHITVLDFSPDGQTLVTKNPDGTVRLWDFATGRPLGQYPSGYNIAPTYSFSPDGKVLATGNVHHIDLW